ncbi:MAG: flavodoxin FldA [Bacteroidales bacterium]|nr:flavodoxin FldA [Bacteroidales bacterium]MDY6001677.1 flavodoxin FldA [Candidatus Cryptobacteroides sp.]
MSKIAIIYGSTTGYCETVAGKIQENIGKGNADIVNVTGLKESVLKDHDVLLLGTSTWGAGDVQDDWFRGIELLNSTDLSGKTVAIFGCGDSASYGDTFCGGMKALYDSVKDKGCKLIGSVPAEGYSFSSSDAVVDGRFVGLPLDEINEEDKTQERIDAWVKDLKNNL